MIFLNSSLSIRHVNVIFCILTSVKKRVKIFNLLLKTCLFICEINYENHTFDSEQTVASSSKIVSSFEVSESSGGVTWIVIFVSVTGSVVIVVDVVVGGVIVVDGVGIVVGVGIGVGVLCIYHVLCQNLKMIQFLCVWKL